ncbi:hypothetical protein PHLCEN_2v4904 [Hermanssonia centrifuga]|uniref:Uncharacterized protein n=1 Tax=Hermanssonia centrifuga TaxID=98765 RepID=A0A2R6PG03_9APHY|nr:hypothetical protein PHLCEN_2v4904 [Hermanssonia centrifuga]
MPKSYKSLGSVDCPGVVRDLDPVLKSQSTHYSTEEIFHVASLPGFKRLPRQLVPNERHVMHPPVYLYGWTISRKKLLKYAKDNNLRQYVQEVIWSHDDSDSDDDENDEDFEPEIVTVYDRSLTIETALCALAKDVGFQIRYQCPLASVLARGTSVSFFALYSNYQLADAPSRDEVTTLWEHLRTRVGVTKPPRWLPDDDELRWRQRCWQ